MKAHFILYVSDQERSTAFYSAVLGILPTLNVRGMTDFTLGHWNCYHDLFGILPSALTAARIVNVLPTHHRR